MKNDSGITLTILVVAIIIMLILSGITIKASMGEDGVVATIKENEFKTYAQMYNDDLGVYVKKQKLKASFNIDNITAGNITGLTKDSSAVVFSTQIESILPDILQEHVEKFVVYKGKLYYVQGTINEKTNKEAEICRQLHIDIWSNN